MRDILSKIAPLKKQIVIIIGVLVIAIVFETCQQLYYIKRFNLVQNIEFFQLLKSQSYKWLVWLLLSTVLVWYTKYQSFKKQTVNYYFNFALVIFILVFLCVLLISIIQLGLNGETYSFQLLVGEYITFFTFQKAPIYTLGYIAVAIIIHFYLTNEVLQIKVEELSELKKTNNYLYKKLSRNIDDKASVLNIKIGNKRKIIPVKDILWIEADDYCVKVHTTNNSSYNMRSTLKALENTLGNNFLRVHRKAIANMDLIKELTLSHTPKLILKSGIEIPVSKSNLKIVKDFIA